MPVLPAYTVVADMAAVMVLT
ncbi:hypothetical protein CEXT_408721, partial [Caerostris extrusa]